MMESAERILQSRNSPREINVDPRLTYNEDFMALMNSPCRPEYDGFFGSTSGEPVRMQYGFRLEIQPLSSITDILDVIEDKIVDSILQASFPEICGLRRLDGLDESSLPELNRDRFLEDIDNHPSGFRFLKFEQTGKCTPQVNDMNFCGIFTGILYMYGKDKDERKAARVVVPSMNEVLQTPLPHKLHPELEAISAIDELLSIEGELLRNTSTEGNKSGWELSRLDVLLIIVSGLISIAILYYFYLQFHERRRNSRDDSNQKCCSHDTKGDHFVDEDYIDDDLKFDPYQEGEESYGDYPSVL